MNLQDASTLMFLMVPLLTATRGAVALRFLMVWPCPSRVPANPEAAMMDLPAISMSAVSLYSSVAASVAAASHSTSSEAEPISVLRAEADAVLAEAVAYCDSKPVLAAFTRTSYSVSGSRPSMVRLLVVIGSRTVHLLSAVFLYSTV